MGTYKQALILPIMGCVLSLLCYLLFHSSNDHGTIYINFIASSGRRRCNTEVELHIHKGSIECTIPEPAEGSEADPSETSPMLYPRRASVDYGSVSQDPMQQLYEERLSIECEEPRTPLSDEERYTMLTYQSILYYVQLIMSVLSDPPAPHQPPPCR